MSPLTLAESESKITFKLQGLSYCRIHFSLRSEAASEMLGQVWWAHGAVSLVIGNQSANSDSAYEAHKQRQTSLLSPRQVIPEHRHRRAGPGSQHSTGWHHENQVQLKLCHEETSSTLCLALCHPSESLCHFYLFLFSLMIRHKSLWYFGAGFGIP